MTVATKTDAKNQQVQYSYDTYKRVVQVRHYPSAGGAEDTTQQVNFSYDTNPYDGGTFSNYTAGRLAAVTYGPMPSAFWVSRSRRPLPNGTTTRRRAASRPSGCR